MILPLLYALSCHHAEEALPPRGDCNPLDPAMCLLPFPSDFYTAETAAGPRVDFPKAAFPENIDMVQIDPALWNEKDGFSTISPMLAYFSDLSLAGVVGHQNIADYAAADAKIVLVDTVTHARVPAWAELDMTAEDPAERLLFIWPAVPLEHGRRYVVGLRGLTHTDGTAVAPSPGFLALRDSAASEDADVERQREHFDADVFPELEGAGVPRGELILAWDYTTASRENMLGRMKYLRDDGLARVAAADYPYTVKRYEDHDCSAADATIGRDIFVTFTVPNYMTEDRPNTLLTRDAAGMPFYNGDTEVDALIRVPCSVIAQPKPYPVLQYGHGLLGDFSEAYTGWLATFANDNRYIVVASTWKGMSAEDVAAISVAIVQDPTGFSIVPERSHQGYLDTLAVMRNVTAGHVADDPLLAFPDREGTPTAVVDRGNPGFYGNSQGGIMGGAYVAMSEDVNRAVLGVPGFPYALLLFRSHDFDDFFKLFKAKFDDHRDISLCLVLFELLWEPAESGGWAYEMRRDAAAPKQVLIHAGIHDAQVTTLGAQMMARSYGASTIAPQTRPIYGVPEAAPGFEGAAIVEFRYTDVGDEPVENLPPATDGDTHECPRREPAGQAQIVDFLNTGKFNQFCDGVCEGPREGVCR
jgi:hypothetical protein